MNETKLLHAALARFSNEVGLICALERGGKISCDEAYDRLKSEWKRVKRLQAKDLGSRQPEHQQTGT